ncbi:MAG: tetratricopeptide repeat protein [Planctomycetota bacterium]|jgi:tetratricopeptide (TPR) repeat protein
MTRTVTILVLVSAICLSGCSLFQKKEEDPTTTEKEKLQQQLDRKFENPKAHYKLAKIYHTEGLYDKAEYHYRTALGFDPVLYKAQAARVKVLQDKGDTASSKMAADLYMDQAVVSAEASMLLGKGFQERQMDEYAVACYQQALALEPNSAVLFRQLGYYYLGKGDKVRAEENLRRSFQLDPYQSEVAGELGRMGVMVQIPREQKKGSGDDLDKTWKEEEAKEEQ